jgi:uncharacterized protein (TIGR00290 family)
MDFIFTAMNTVLNWSSGKDAALAYHLLLQQDVCKVTHLLTTINAEHDRIFMHGVRESLLDAQAQRMGLPLEKLKLPPSPDDGVYKTAMAAAFDRLKQQGVTTAAYGDIFLEDLKQYREAQLAAAGIGAAFPLWQRNTRELIHAVEDTGIEAMIVCVNGKVLGKEFLGRKIDRSLLADLPEGVDPCGENGEYHSFVYNAPYFREPVPVTKGETVFRQYDTAENSWGFYFLDLQ